MPPFLAISVDEVGGVVGAAYVDAFAPQVWQKIKTSLDGLACVRIRLPTLCCRNKVSARLLECCEAVVNRCWQDFRCVEIPAGIRMIIAQVNAVP